MKEEKQAFSDTNKSLFEKLGSKFNVNVKEAEINMLNSQLTELNHEISNIEEENKEIIASYTKE